MNDDDLLLRLIDDRARCAAELRQADKEAIAATLLATEKAAQAALEVAKDAKERGERAWRWAITSLIALAALVIAYLALGHKP